MVVWCQGWYNTHMQCGSGGGAQILRRGDRVKEGAGNDGDRKGDDDYKIRLSSGTW